MHADTLYIRHRFPAEIISCVWLYYRCTLSYRDVEELMAERNVTVTYETIRNGARNSVVRMRRG
jgi:putative transposase